MPLALLDTTLLSNFAQVRRPDLLRAALGPDAAAILRNGRFLSDDFAARRIAASRGVVVSGTLGVLAKLVQNGRLSLVEADDLLRQMIDRGYRSPVRSLEDLQAGEDG